MEQIRSFRHDLLPLAKPISPTCTGHLHRPYTKEELADLRTRAEALEPFRLTKTGKLRKRIEPIVAAAWDALVVHGKAWGAYMEAAYRLNLIFKMLRHRKDEIANLRTCQQLYFWLRAGMRFNLVDRQRPERPSRYKFHEFVITPGYGVPGENIRTGLSCDVLSYKDNQWRPSIIDCSWLAHQTLCNLVPVSEEEQEATHGH